MVNMKFYELIKGINKENYLDTARIMKVKYGITMKHIARISGFSYSSLKTALRYDTTDQVLRDCRVLEACERIKTVYIR